MVIFGPAHYGFLGLYNWQDELTATPSDQTGLRTSISSNEDRLNFYGKQLVDVYDFHWYPEEYDLCTSTSSLRSQA